MTEPLLQGAPAAPGIAVIGMAGRFPGASTIEQFWENLRAGVDSVSRFTPEEMEVSLDTSQRPGYMPVRSILKDVDQFDATFFGIYPREAEQMDPQHRIFLECCWEALERGGYDPGSYPGAIGLFAGCSMNTYFMRHLARDRAFLERFTEEYQSGSYIAMLGNDKDFLPTRISYKLNLRGPSIAVQSACSTSLVAICQACQSLLTYSCDMALAGGVSITFPQHRGYMPEEGGINSTDGVIRPFDHRARGTVFGSGSGVVLLKRLDEALESGDQILAVIRGFALNNDGSLKAGYTAPSIDGQAEVISAAQAMAGFDPGSISYVETHGTGTPLGDPIEIAGLARAFAAAESKTASCLIGTAKANVGHLDVAAGVTGLIKTILQMQHREIPGLLHYEAPNPEIHLERTPFAINREAVPWRREDTPLRAGVSAFGVGGTNAHVVLEEAPPLGEPDVHSTDPELLVVSARTETALQSMRERLAAHLETHPGVSLRDIAYTLTEGRARYAFRSGVAASTGPEAIAHLRSTARKVQPAFSRPRVVFVFPGQGAQKLNMARTLYETEPVFREALLLCEEIVQPLLGESLLRAIYPDQESADATVHLNQTRLAQPAIFAIEFALAQLWMSLGVEPALLIGHSIGEYVAATLAQTLTLHEALRLVTARGALMQSLPPGSMLAVRATEEQVRSLISDPSLNIAAVNAPSALVLAGADEEVEAWAAKLQNASIATRKLATSHAFHSKMMEPVLAPFGKELQSIGFQAPRIPWVSTLTGQLLTGPEIAAAGYWQRQLREPVAFFHALKAAAAIAGKEAVFLEVGPSATILGAMRQTLAGTLEPSCILASLPDQSNTEKSSSVNGTSGILPVLGHLWTLGVEPHWSKLRKKSGQKTPRRVLLPTYPFERKRHWIEAPASPSPLKAQPNPHRTDEPKTRGDHFISMPTPTSTSPDAITAGLIADLKVMVGELSDLDLTTTPATTSFVELGLDSLFLTQLTQAVRQKYGVKLTFRQVMSEFGSFAGLAGHLVPHLPSSPAPPLPVSATRSYTPAAASTPAQEPAASPLPGSPLPPPISTVAPGPEYSSLFAQQLHAVTDLVQRQLQLLERTTAPNATPLPLAPLPSHAAPPLASKQLTSTTSQPEAARLHNEKADNQPAETGRLPKSDDIAKEKELGTLVPLKPLEMRKEAPLTAKQEEHVAALVTRYTQRTARSKAHVQQFRSVLADPRVASGFHPNFKELTYPLVVEKAAGAYLWDTNGNRYIDILNGYGSILFGHSPDFVTEAVRRQLDLGFPIGPQTELAGECAQLLSQLTGMERVSFCNTGSEAVMAALRLARTVTGRSLVVLFSGAYHGMMDEVLVKSTRSERSLPAAPGIPRESVSNMLVLEYGSSSALDVIRRRKDEIAAVLVEPIQSRHPALRPVEFLQEIRSITAECGAALIFDEVVTGFRTHPGGAQALFGVQADLATYGKVVAGGMPVGVIAGRRAYMDALDGGSWRFGDDSFPEVGVTFFAGTFVRHPLTMAAVKSVLQHIQAAGPQLQQAVAQKSTALAHDLQLLFSEFQFPSTIEYFSSWFFFPYPSEMRLARLLYHHLRERGLHIQEGFPCFLSTAHTEEDLQVVRSTFRAALAAMREGELFAAVNPSIAPSKTVSVLNGAIHPSHHATPALAIQSTAAATAAGVAPITEAQREILLASQLGDEASCAFNESVTLTLDGQFDQEAFQFSLTELVSRHEALRLIIASDGETIVVSPTGALSLRREDWSLLDAEVQQRRRNELLQSEAVTPFNLQRGPLARAMLISLAPERHLFVLTGHHIILDGWSINVFFEELGALYSAATSGEAPSLLPVQSMLEYAASEQERLLAPDYAETEAFWVERMSNAASLLQLPTDRARPVLRSHGGNTYRHSFSPEFTRLVKDSARQSGSTVFTSLLSGIAATLSRLAQQDDFVISVPIAGQREISKKSMVGHSVCFLPLRMQPNAALPFETFAAGVRNAVFDALDHSQYTVGSLVRKLKLPRNSARLDFAEVQFNFEQVGARTKFRGVRAHLEANPKAAVNADLFFNFVDQGSQLLLDCDYNTTLFDESTIARWTACFEALLRDAIAKPACAVGELRLLDDLDMERILVDWNKTAHEYPREATVSEIFADQAAKSPDAIALCFGDSTFTYAEVNQQADRLAAWLVTRLEGSSAPRIAISFERSPELIVTILAILKAGGTYIPIDPSYPAARLALLTADARPDLLLTHQRLLQHFIELPVQTISWEDIRLPNGTTPPKHLPSNNDANKPAYMMYTSGSTGKPKGVLVPHRAIVRLVKHTNYAAFGPDEVFLQLAPISFDAATLEIWGALLNGGRLVLMPGTKPSPEEIGAVIKQQGVTTIWLTAALFHLMIMDHIEIFQHLRQVLAGGDVLSLTLVRKLLASAPKLRLINGYGPTENTTFTCCHTIRAEDLQAGSVPIGRPIANTRVYILDRQHQPVPIGVPGELYAGGDGLAIQYWNAPELTMAKFVTLHLGPAGQERLYKTGDIARYGSDGVIEFLGRADSQIKIRGFRVELGEIEYAAEQFSGVRAAVASARPDWMTAEDVPGDRRLALYIIPESAIDPVSLKRELRQHLRSQLPEHMQPHAILFLEQFPRTVNGKVDHRALPAPEAEQALTGNASGEPRTLVEGKLAAIWSQVLKLPKVGIHDSIFELGGDSLSIFRITTQANQAGICLTAKHIFQYKTIAALSPEVENGGLAVSSEHAAPVSAIKAIPRDQFRKVQTL